MTAIYIMALILLICVLRQMRKTRREIREVKRMQEEARIYLSLNGHSSVDQWRHASQISIERSKRRRDG